MTHRDDSCSRIFIHRDILAIRLRAITVHDDSSYCETENQSRVTQIVLGTMQPTTRTSADRIYGMYISTTTTMWSVEEGGEKKRLGAWHHVEAFI